MSILGTIQKVGTMANQEETRFRSFAERYVIERASSFKVGNEDADGWEAIQRAKTAYKQIAMMAAAAFPDLKPGQGYTGSIQGATNTQMQQMQQMQQYKQQAQKAPVVIPPIDPNMTAATALNVAEDLTNKGVDVTIAGHWLKVTLEAISQRAKSP